jgi:hypothetical protein
VLWDRPVVVAGSSGPTEAAGCGGGRAAGAVPVTDGLVDGPKADAGPGAAALALVVDKAK